MSYNLKVRQKSLWGWICSGPFVFMCILLFSWELQALAVFKQRAGICVITQCALESCCPASLRWQMEALSHPACLGFPLPSPSPQGPGQGGESRVWCCRTWDFRPFLKSQFRYHLWKYVQPLGHLIVINLERIPKSGCIKTSFLKFALHKNSWGRCNYDKHETFL